MRCFKIPFTHLDLFLVACELNFGDIRPEYIFQYEDHYQTVFVDKIPEVVQEKIDKFIAEMWANALAMGEHSRPVRTYASRNRQDGRD